MLPASTRLGPYEIIAPIGAGGMGEVYRARDTRLGRDVAVKVLPEPFVGDSARLARFEREAKAVAALAHPNILVLYDIGTSGSMPYVVTELLEGETLRQRVKQAALPWREAAAIGLAVANGLVAAHAKGIIHRDLKPDNVFLTTDGQAKILDFGLVRVETQTSLAAEKSPHGPTLTEAGIVMGTAGYMSPEQICGEAVDARSDLFSLGCILYEMLSGCGPFARETPPQALIATLQDEPLDLKSPAGPLPPGVDLAIRHCLEKDRDKRFQTARELAIALQGLITDPGMSRPGRPAAGRRLRFAAKVGIALVPVLLIGAIVIHSRNRDGLNGDPGGSTAARQAIESIAVLPLLNKSRVPIAESLSDGVPRTIIRSFLEIPHLNVRPFSSVAHYAARETLDPREVGRQLEVEAVLAGTIATGDTAPVITVELMDTRNNRSLWLQAYDLHQDVLFIQDDILKEVAAKLGLQLSSAQRERLARRPTQDTAAYLEYLEGLHSAHLWTVADTKRGIDRLERALSRDPNFALAQASLADAYIAAAYIFMEPRVAFEKARQAAAEALKKDALLADAHAAIGTVKFHADWDWAGAEKDFKEALRLNPRSAFSHDYYGWYWLARGEADKAIAAIQKAIELEPRSTLYNPDLAFVYQHCRQFDKAEEQVRKTLELDPDNAMAPWALALVLAHRDKNYAAAVEQAEIFIERDKQRPDGYGVLGWLYAIQGKHDKAREMLDELDRLSKEHYVRSEPRAWIYLGLGDKDQAFRCLSQVCDERSPGMVYLMLDPTLEPLRGDPRFAALLRRIGLAK